MVEIKLKTENKENTIEGDFVLAIVIRDGSRSVVGAGELSAHTLFALAEELQPSEVAGTLGGGNVGDMYKEIFDFFNTTDVSIPKDLLEEGAR